MKKIILLFFVLMLNSALFAQISDTTSAEVQDTIKVLSAEDNQQAERYYNQGVGLFSEGQYSNASSKFDQAIEIKANFPKAYYNRALCYIELKDLSSALTDLGSAITLDPNAKFYFRR